MTDRIGLWILASEVNRRTKSRSYIRLRINIPAIYSEGLLKIVDRDGTNGRIYYQHKLQGKKIVLIPTEPPKPNPKPISIKEKADQIIRIIENEGGVTTWPKAREHLGLPSNSTPSPFLVRELKKRGMQTYKDPRTSTMIWKFIRGQQSLRQYPEVGAGRM